MDRVCWSVFEWSVLVRGDVGWLVLQPIVLVHINSHEKTNIVTHSHNTNLNSFKS